LEIYFDSGCARARSDTDEAFDADAQTVIRKALERNRVLPGEECCAKLESLTKLRVGASCRGRPPKLNVQ